MFFSWSNSVTFHYHVVCGEEQWKKKKKSGSSTHAIDTDKDLKKNAYTKFYFPNRNTGISK